MIKLRCPSCTQKLNVPPKLAGKSVKCPKCAEPLQIPQDHSSLNEPDPLVDESFLDISEFLAPDEISQSLPGARRTKPLGKTSTKKQLRASEKECRGCGKAIAKNDRYCMACGFNDFDAAETAVLTQQKMHDRLDGQVAGLFLFRWLRDFSRFFR